MADRLTRLIGDERIPIPEDKVPHGVRQEIERRRFQPSSEQEATADNNPPKDIGVWPPAPSRYQRMGRLEDFMLHTFAARVGWSAVPPLWGLREGMTDLNGATILGLATRGKSGRRHVLLDLSCLAGRCGIFLVGLAAHELEHHVAGHCDPDPSSPLFAYEADPEGGERRADNAAEAAITEIANYYDRRKRSPEAPTLNPAACVRCFKERAEQCRQPACLPDVQAKLRF